MNTQNSTLAPSTRTRKVRRLLIDDLEPHPLHQTLFGPVPEEQIASLTREMARDPHLSVHVEAAPCGWVLLGVPYLEAARRAGWKAVEVTIREDLEAVGETVERLELIHLHLRHSGLSEVATARCLAFAHDIARYIPEERRREYLRGSLQEVVARYLCLTPRSTSRYLAIVTLPLPIQQAFDDGRIPRRFAERVADLCAAQPAIAQAIDGGADPVQVVRRYLEAQPRRPRRVDESQERFKATRRFARKLAKAYADLAPRAGLPTAKPDDGPMDILCMVVNAIAQIKAKGGLPSESQQKANREALRARLAPESAPVVPPSARPNAEASPPAA